MSDSARRPARCEPGNDSERTVRFQAVIQVDADDDHLIEDGGGRLHMDDAFLHGPGGEAGSIDAGFDGDGQVLMPGDFPVRGGRLVKEGGSDGAGARAEDRVYKGADGSGIGKGARGGDAFERIADAAAALQDRRRRSRRG